MKPTVPRTKAWKPKVKTGCRTCRKRRIKCDEGKPCCRNCTKTGRHCDGYEDLGAKALVRRRSSSSSSSSSSASSPWSLLNDDPGQLVGTTEERQSFHFFRSHTVPEFGGFFDSSGFLLGSLQASQHLPEIRHALTAIGAMHHKFMIGNAPVVPDDPTDAHVRFALQQFSQSLTNLRQKSTVRPERETILTLSILYFAFATLQGDNGLGLQHLKSAMHMLAEIRGNQPSKNPSHPLTVGLIQDAFIGLDTLARAMLPDANLREWLSCPSPAVDIGEPPNEFNTLAEAATWFENNFNALLASLQENGHAPSNHETWKHGMKQHMEFSWHFRKATASLDKLVERDSKIFTPKQRSMVALLNLYRSVSASTLTILATIPMNGERAWDSVKPAHTAIVDCAARVLGEIHLDELAATVQRTYNAREYYPNECDEYCAEIRRIMDITKRRPSFSCRFGVVFPLYLVAARCRDPLLRRKALALLIHYPRREGLWDGMMAARLAFEVMCMEEDAVTGPVNRASDIPEEVRVRGVAIQYTGPRRAEVVITTVFQIENKLDGVKRIITW